VRTESGDERELMQSVKQERVEEEDKEDWERSESGS